MPLANNDIHVTAIRRTIVRDQKGDNVPGYELHFTIRDQGDYVANLPIKDFSSKTAMEAIAAIATPIVDVLDMYPGK